MTTTDTGFTGSIPEMYERYLVPLIFRPYAEDLALRLGRLRPERVLELAAGTGVVTRELSRALPGAKITATDLNQPMLYEAARVASAASVEFRQADATELPFADSAFDAVVCQFGVMFFPDRAKAYAEARRVLRPGGRFVFNVWERLERNHFAQVVGEALTAEFPDNPPHFMERVPHGYFDETQIRRDLKAGGFSQDAEVSTLATLVEAASARDVAIAYCQGTPLRNEIEARAPGRIEAVTRRVEAALTAKYGSGAVRGQIEATVVVVVK